MKKKSDVNNYEVTESDFDSLVVFVEKKALHGMEYGPLSLLESLPHLSDDQLKYLVGKAIEAGLFENGSSEGRIKITLDGIRRANIAQYRQRQLPRLPFEWNSIPGFSLADAILVFSQEKLQNRFAIWIEDLYTSFATTKLSMLQGAVQELRECKLFQEADPIRLGRLANGVYHLRDLAWASGITRDGVRKVAKLQKNENVQKLMTPEVFDMLNEMLPNPKEKDVRDKVFVVHGRNIPIRDAMFDFIRALGLDPIEWEHAIAVTKAGTPYVGDVIEKAIRSASAVVVLLTPDDEGRLLPEFHEPYDPSHEINLTPQARQNVLFEAGMAFGVIPEKTFLVQIGSTRPFSDVTGRNTIRFSGDERSRNVFASRLENVGILVDKKGTDWLRAGNFNIQTALLRESSVVSGDLRNALSNKNRVVIEENRYVLTVILQYPPTKKITEHVFHFNCKENATKMENILVEQKRGAITIKDDEDKQVTILTQYIMERKIEPYRF